MATNLIGPLVVARAFAAAPVPPAPAADEGHLDGVGLSRVARPGNGRGQSRADDRFAGGLEEFATGGAVLRCVE